MTNSKPNFMYDAGNDNISTNSNNSDFQTNNISQEEKKEGKSFFRKIKDALQDWSNGDKRDEEFDDTRV